MVVTNPARAGMHAKVLDVSMDVSFVFAGSWNVYLLFAGGRQPLLHKSLYSRIAGGWERGGRWNRCLDVLFF